MNRESLSKVLKDKFKLNERQIGDIFDQASAVGPSAQAEAVIYPGWHHYCTPEIVLERPDSEPLYYKLEFFSEGEPADGSVAEQSGNIPQVVKAIVQGGASSIMAALQKAKALATMPQPVAENGCATV